MNDWLVTFANETDSKAVNARIIFFIFPVCYFTNAITIMASSSDILVILTVSAAAAITKVSA